MRTYIQYSSIGQSHQNSIASVIKRYIPEKTQLVIKADDNAQFGTKEVKSVFFSTRFDDIAIRKCEDENERHNPVKSTD